MPHWTYDRDTNDTKVEIYHGCYRYILLKTKKKTSKIRMIKNKRKIGPYNSPAWQFYESTKGQSISKANVEVFIWTKKGTKIFLYLFPTYLKYIGQIKKRMQIIILEYKQSLISMIMGHYFYDLIHFRG